MPSCLFLALAACVGTSPQTSPVPGPTDKGPLDDFTRHWRQDAAWHDGQVETCLYDAKRTVHGEVHHFQTTLITHKQWADPHTKTRSTTPTGREVFKQHLVEGIRAGQNTQHLSTMCFLGTTDLKSLKIDVAWQDARGTTFKQFVNHAGTLTWHSFVHLAGGGHTHGTYEPPPNLAFQDGLSLVLRGYPFDAPPPPIELALLPDQTSRGTTSPRPRRAVLRHLGAETLIVPAGRIATDHLSVSVGPNADQPEAEHHYWFAADGRAPWLHAMIQYRGPGGVRYRLVRLWRRQGEALHPASGPG